MILAIGKIIRYDFSKEFPQLAETKTKTATLAESKIKYETDRNSVEYWKNKYLLLLEEYNQLLKSVKSAK